MSKNFELLHQLQKEPQLLEPADDRRRLPGTTALGQTHLHPAAPRDETEWLRALGALRTHWRMSALFAGSVMVAVVLMTLLTKPVYAPEARVEIDPPGAELFTMEARGGAVNPAEYLETQARNMQSEELLVGLIRSFRLDQNPEFTSRSFLSRSLSAVLGSIQRLPTSLWGRKRAEQFSPRPADMQFLTPAEASTLQALKSRVSVNRDTASRLVNVSFASHDAVLSATVTNALVHSFIERTYQTRHDAIMQSTEWLSRQLDDIRTKLENSNRALVEFQSTSGIADVDQNRSTFTEQMAELSRQKTQAQGERILLGSYLRRVRGGRASDLPQVQSNQVVAQLTQRLGETRAELSQTLAVYGKNHPNARKLQNQAEELESQVRLQQNAILAQMETSYAAALAREQMIDNQMRGTARELSQMAQYTALKKEAEATADLYNTLYARVKEAGITAASKSTNIRVVDQARVLDSPTRPRPLINFGVGLLVALVGGVLLAFGSEALDNRIHTPEDVRRSTGISAISIVPLAVGDGRSTFIPALASRLHRGRARWLDGPAKFLLDEPRSAQSEAIRGIHTAVMLSRPDQPPRMLMVASSVPGEGKTTVAINLAMALAQQGRTCILDADLRRPSLAKTFHLNGVIGLGDFLGGSVPLEAILSHAPEMADLTVISAGSSVADPGKLINSERMRRLVHNLRQQYDFVVIDSPPILPYADGRALAPFVDGVVFVGRAGVVTRDAMSRSIELLQEVHSAPILEIVLNAAQRESQSYGYRYDYSRDQQN